MWEIMINYLQDPTVWVSLISITISIIALFQTNKQIKLSNKQQLFDRRLEQYTLLKDLLILYKNSRSFIAKNQDICEMVDFQFAMLTNCVKLEEIAPAIYKPLHEDTHKKYLTKIENLDKNAMEIELLWNTEEGKLASQFVFEYKELLQAFYKQQIWINYYKKEQGSEMPISSEEFKKRTKEKANQIDLYGIINRIDDIYNTIVSNNVEKKLANSIRL